MSGVGGILGKTIGIVFPASWVSGLGLTEGLLGGGGDCDGTWGEAFQVDPSFKLRLYDDLPS
jgi:hypothetical protein